MTELTSVVAISENNVIADGSRIPWDYPVDKQQYKARIQGSPLVIGRKTYETMMVYETELLKQSDLVVLTTDETYETDISYHSVANGKDEALDWVENQTEIVYNIGGGQIYKLLWEETEQLIVSHIPENVEGTVYFPQIDETKWKIISTEQFERFTVKTYIRP